MLPSAAAAASQLASFCKVVLRWKLAGPLGTVGDTSSGLDSRASPPADSVKAPKKFVFCALLLHHTTFSVTEGSLVSTPM
jgi:hypothetical protein